jgi:hypothetical protein
LGSFGGQFASYPASRGLSEHTSLILSILMLLKKGERKYVFVKVRVVRLSLSEKPGE